jgi:predicted transposase YbfD/YdcC
MNFSIEGTGQEFEWGDEGQGVRSLYEQLQALKDKRKRRGIRYPLAVLLVMVIVAKLSGQDEVRGIAEWIGHRAAGFRRALALKHPKTPHATTISRVLNEAVEIDALEQVVANYFKAQAQAEEAIALDGKALRGTIEAGQTRGQHLLAVYATQTGVVLGQMAVDEKANEIVVAPELLKTLPLVGRVVTGDAMFAQHALSKQIVEGQGDYLWLIKNNQPSLRAAIERLFAPEKCSKAHSPLLTDFQSASSLDKGHGRLERRWLTSSSLLNAYADWEGLGQVFKIERLVTHLKDGLVTHQVEYGITSLTADRASAQSLLQLVRDHWHIENGLHYPRDVSFHEDACHIRWPVAHRAIAILNNLALGLIRQLDFAFVPSARRFLDANFQLAIQLVC